MDKYTPGVCNIGPEERRSRMLSGVAGLIFGTVLFVVLLVISAPAFFRLLIFFPAFAAAVGFLQSYFHFCAGFGLRGIYNVINNVGKTDSVEVAEFRKQDRKRALKIIALSVIIAAVSTFIFLLI